ncbi:MAG TPA: chemotaxis protein CheW [Lachnospiraceae bacterium]|jgi:Chemotaxis signal transduction protein|nr:chemotaxis protein CheW [Lachnospiraceae bacterium]
MTNELYAEKNINEFDIDTLGTSNDNSKKYLTFISDGLVFGIPIDNVIEIITNHTVTMLPRVPDYVQGIINLRGQIIPIIDIRLRMNKPAAEPSSSSCVIILEVDSIAIGILVDVVLQVFDIENKVTPPPSKSQEFISGMTTLADGTVIFCMDCKLLVNSK